MLLYHLNKAAKQGAQKGSKAREPLFKKEDLDKILEELKEETIKLETKRDSLDA